MCDVRWSMTDYTCAMRLFVGVELSDATRDRAMEISTELRRTLGRTLDARWVAAENMHLTVRFIGYVHDDEARALVEALARPLDTAAFDMELSGCGRFPPRGSPRVLWVGLTRGLESLAALHGEFNRRLAPLGHEPEDRPFSAHLTLARVKDSRAGSAKLVDAAFESIATGTLTQRVDVATVFESRLTPRGPNYHAIRRVPLRC